VDSPAKPSSTTAWSSDCAPSCSLFTKYIIIYIQGYLPYDSSGDIIFKFQELLATGLAGYILYCISVPFKSSYNQDLDIIKSWYLMIVALVLAIFFHSNLNRSLFGDLAWAFTQYLETFAILSQFILFSKKVKP
jgi:hypothetical protein